MFLALETATNQAGIALLDAGRVLAERELGEGLTQASQLLAVLDRLLDDSARRLEEIEWIALSVGPGSFTGLRIGLATALGLCFGTPRRIVPVSTLAALSLGANGPERIVPLLDARKQQVYTGLYGPAGRLIREDRVIDPAAWFESLKDEGPCWLVGPGARMHADLALEILEARVQLPQREERPRAAHVGRLALRLAAEGSLRDPREVVLRYLRRPEAEQRRLLDTAPGNP